MPDANLYHESAVRGSDILMREHPLTTQELGKPHSWYVHSTQMHLIHIANMLTQSWKISRPQGEEGVWVVERVLNLQHP